MPNTLYLDRLDKTVSARIVGVLKANIREVLRNSKAAGKFTKADCEMIANAATTCKGMLPE